MLHDNGDGPTLRLVQMASVLFTVAQQGYVADDLDVLRQRRHVLHEGRTQWRRALVHRAALRTVQFSEFADGQRF